MSKPPVAAPAQPNLPAEMSSLKATQAPVIFFEVSSTHGVRNGVANITLEGGMHFAFNGQVINESRVMAHLRFPVAAIPSLRASLDAIDLLMQPVPEGPKN